MRSFIYPYIPFGVMQEKLTLSCASAVLLVLVSLHHAPAQAQSAVEAPQQARPQQISPQLSAEVPALPKGAAQEKYQQLQDAGIFSSSTTPLPALDGNLTRAQFAKIAALIQALDKQPGSTSFAVVDTEFPTGVSVEFVASAVPASLGQIEGVSGNANSTVKPSDIFSQLFAALEKNGGISQADLDQLKTTPGLNNVSAPVAESQLLPSNEAAIRAAAIAAANAFAATESAGEGAVAVVVPGFSGISASALATISSGIAAAAALEAANNIALADAARQAAQSAQPTNYNVVTSSGNWPTNLNATFNGRVIGALSDSSAVGGNLTMNVNFATIRSAAPITGNVLFDNSKGSASLNLVQIGGFVGGGMTGTYDSQAMTGFIRNGQFYGPAANAVKGSWDMTTSSVSGGGTFSANR